ncbi:ATP12-domain-containing protein [Sistotremastrum suecicum HHB10207 ss-3]|uniref:ATP12-domain-containing protein n=1 Tax=Sistotremastrum suecicum HHB10207 ss-3 TaxID=1314776 RepID=A0A166ALG6_9AGAM|nr:ATP12-domain-containing protein [Sistotremastrum suecicum HHB10207 ss-3]
MRLLAQSCRRFHFREPLGLRFYATPAPDGPAVTATNRAAATLKRFWNTVDVESHNQGLVVTLDGRPLKTPSNNVLVIPPHRPILASLIASEWDNLDKVIKSHALPMTSIASRAVDGLNDHATRSEVVKNLLNYLQTDTICFHESHPPALVDLQKIHWDPILNWARKTYSVEIKTFETILRPSQPAASLQTFERELSNLDTWELAALERAVYSTKSFLVAFALLKQRLSVEEAAQASEVEVRSQIQRWGEVEDSHDVDYQDIRRLLGSVACVLLREG